MDRTTFSSSSTSPGEAASESPGSSRGSVNDYVLPLLGGAVAGAVATGPMTGFMAAAHRYLPWYQRHPLPPKAITMDLLHRVNLKQRMNRKQRRRATWMAHVAYGTGIGAFYGAFSRYIPLPPAVKGIGYGLLVWAGSYLGWLPAFNVSGAATEQPLRRNLLMVGAHVVWGGVAGPIAARFERR